MQLAAAHALTLVEQGIAPGGRLCLSLCRLQPQCGLAVQISTQSDGYMAL